jgi:hypothetical protein
MRLRYFLFGVLTTLVVVLDLQLGIHLLTPSQPKFGTDQRQNFVPALYTVPKLRPQPEVPRNWGPPHEFNGQPYYVIPISRVGQTF